MLSFNLLMHLISTFKITFEGVMGKHYFIVKYQMKTLRDSGVIILFFFMTYMNTRA